MGSLQGTLALFKTFKETSFICEFYPDSKKAVSKKSYKAGGMFLSHCFFLLLSQNVVWVFVLQCSARIDFSVGLQYE